VKNEKKAPKRAIKNPLLFTLAVQLLVVSPVLLILAVFEPDWVSSCFWGWVIYVLPNAYFTFYAFRYRDVRQSQEIVRSFYAGEQGKLALAAVGFALVFHSIPDVNAPVLFASYGGLIVLQWLIASQIAARIKN